MCFPLSPVHDSQPPSPLCPPPSHLRAARPCWMPSCSYEPQLLKKWSQKSKPIKTETAVTILHSMVLISLSFVCLPLFFSLSLSLFLSFSLQLPLPHTPPSVLGPEIEQEILSPSAQPCNSKRRLEFILNNQLQNKQSQGEVETRGMSWESCHQRQVQRFFFFNKNNRAGSQICSFSGCCCQRRACWWWSPQKPFFAFSSVCLHLPLQMEPVLKFLLDCYLQ